MDSIFIRYFQELRILSKLATPIALSQLALIGIGVTDVIVSGRAGIVDLAGVTLGNNVWMLVILFFFGISIANQPLVSELYGKGDWPGLTRQFQQSLWMSLFTGLVGVAAVLFSSVLLVQLGIEAGIERIAVTYIRVMALAAVAMTVLPVLRTTLESTNQTGVVMAINIFGFLINIPLDIALVHGCWGLPRLGGIGCAWASVAVLWTSVLCSYGFVLVSKKTRDLHLMKNFVRPDFGAIKKVMLLGLPIGFSIIIEFGFFSGAAIVIAKLGDVSVSAHAVAISAASVAYMIYFGIAQGIAILGAQRLGEGSRGRAVFGIYSGIALTFLLSLFLSVVFVLFRYDIAALYTKDLEVIELAGQLLIWSAFFQIADALQATSVCGLRAFKDTVSPLRYQLIAFWVVAFPLGYLLAIREIWPALVKGPEGFWMAMTAGLALAAIFIFLKLWQVIGDQRKKVSQGPPA